MRFVGRCYRGHDPRWSFSPLSGEGAAIAGGRFKRKGDPALYLSLGIVTAVAECTQGFAARLRPLTVCEYEIDCDAVADLRDEAVRIAHGIDLAELSCPWLDMMLAGREPPSWRVAARLREAGHAGLLVPSFVPGATESDVNIVLWHWSDAPPCALRVYDPDARLPRDRSSWPEVE